MDYTLHLVFRDEDSNLVDIRVGYAKDESQYTDAQISQAMDDIISGDTLRSPSGRRLLSKVRAYLQGVQAHEFSLS